VLDFAIFMGNDIALSNDSLPGDLWVRLFELIGDTTSCFTNDLQ